MSDLPIPNKRIPACPGSGVYFLFDGDELVYVGKSNNILNRVGQHTIDYGRGSSKKIFDSYSVLLCAPEEMAEIESKYIIRYKPKYNLIGHKSISQSKSAKPAKFKEKTIFVGIRMPVSLLKLIDECPEGRAAAIRRALDESLPE